MVKGLKRKIRDLEEAAKAPRKPFVPSNLPPAPSFSDSEVHSSTHKKRHTSTYWPNTYTYTTTTTNVSENTVAVCISRSPEIWATHEHSAAYACTKKHSHRGAASSTRGWWWVVVGGGGWWVVVGGGGWWVVVGGGWWWVVAWLTLISKHILTEF